MSNESAMRDWPAPPPAVSFVVYPLPPSDNNAYVPRKDGKGRALTSACKEWQTAAGWCINSQCQRRLIGPVWVLLEMPYQRGRDIPNVKLLLDLISARSAGSKSIRLGIIEDDRMIDDLRIIRVPRDQPLRISIWQL